MAGLAGFGLYQSQQASRQRVEKNNNLEQNQLLHEAAVNAMAFSPDGQFIASGSRDKTVRIWDAKTGNPIGQPPQCDGAVGQILDAALRTFDLDWTDEPPKCHSAAVNAVVFSPDGQLIASGSQDKTVRLWDAKTGNPIGQPTGNSFPSIVSLAFRHEAAVNAVAFSPDGQRIASGGADKTVRLWDAQTGNAIGQPFQGHEGGVYSVAFSPDGQRIVSGGWDGTVRLWEMNSIEAICDQLRYHPSLNQRPSLNPPNRNTAREAKKVCEN
jgi:WD40 repeat protein